MPPRQHHSQPWGVAIAFVAGDATKTIKAAPGVGNRLVVTKLSVHITTTAAQAIDVEDTSGTVEVLKLGISAPVNGEYTFDLERGIDLTVNEALIYKPAAAGPAGHVIAEGYITGAYGG